MAKFNWDQEWIDALNPLSNGVVSLIFAITAGALVYILIRLVGKPILEQLLIPIFRSINAILINRVAPLSGVKLKSSVKRWIALLSLMTGLSLTAAFTPLAVAALSISFGVIVSVAIYQSWEKDEQERENAEDNGLNYEISNDLGNEILAVAAFVIALFTLGFARLSELESVYSGQPVFPVLTSALYIWGEILKAVPFVDVSEVYGIKNASGIEVDGALGKGYTLAFRVFLDLMLVAGLFRIVSIYRRRASGRDLRDIRRQLILGDDADINKAFVKLQNYALAGAINAQNELERLALQERENGKLKEPDFLLKVGVALYEVGERQGSRKFYLLANEAYKVCGEKWSKEQSPLNWAVIQNNMANCQQRIGEATGSLDNLEASLRSYQAALTVRTQKSTPIEWASTQHNLGNSLQEIGAKLGSKDHLNRSIIAYMSALEARKREHHPKDWASTQNSLGNSIQQLGILERSSDRLKASIIAYESALQVHTKDSMPIDWATTQNNLGNTLQKIGEFEKATSYLEQSIVAYEKALLVREPKSMPGYWASTQNNLGNTLQTLGSITKSSAILKQSVAAFEKVLRVQTRESVPASWASAQNNLGSALQLLGRTESSAAILKKSVQAYEAALEVRTLEDMPHEWAATKNNLGNTLQDLGRLEGSRELLSQSLLSYRDAAQIRNRESSPINWAVTQRNLANTLYQIAVISNEKSHFYDAITAYYSCLEVFSKLNNPKDWSATNSRLAGVLSDYACRFGETSKWEEAVTHYRLALEVITFDDQPTHWANDTNSLGVALLKVGQLAIDIDAMQQANSLFSEVISNAKNDRLAEQRIMARHNRAYSYLHLAFHQSESESESNSQIESAISDFDEVLKVRERDSDPTNWAATIVLKGAAHCLKASLSGSLELMSDGEKLVSEGLDELSPVSAPEAWRFCQIILVAALLTIGLERKSSSLIARGIERAGTARDVLLNHQDEQTAKVFSQMMDQFTEEANAADFQWASAD